MMYTFEYIMCYKEAFALGIVTGLLIAVVVIRKIKEKHSEV